jgi:hypothetical protein
MDFIGAIAAATKVYEGLKLLTSLEKNSVNRAPLGSSKLFRPRVGPSPCWTNLSRLHSGRADN